jgi:hypothetical protein
LRTDSLILFPDLAKASIVPWLAQASTVHVHSTPLSPSRLSEIPDLSFSHNDLTSHTMNHSLTVVHNSPTVVHHLHWEWAALWLTPSKVL